jgi:hypothetical protein
MRINHCQLKGVKILLCSFLVLILFGSGFSNAQETSASRDLNPSEYSPATGVRGSILGSIIYPGFKIGVDRPFKYTKVEKFRTMSPVFGNKTKTYYKERYLSYNFGMYHQKSYHTNYLVQTEWIARRQKSKGFYVESSFGLGLSRTFVDGATYSVSDNGEIKKVPLAGNWFALASVGGGIGYNANSMKQKPFSIYLKHQWIFLFPYNAFVTPRPIVELGFNYNLSGFWDASPKFKHKTKQSRKFSNSQNK